MGTNYYFKPSSGPLKAYAYLHIGKHSGGWEFIFQGFDVQGGKRLVEVDRSGLRVKADIPALRVRSWEEWKQLLRDTPGVLEDEYGTVYAPQEFEALVQQASPGNVWGPERKPLLNHYDYVRSQTTYRTELTADNESEWKDPQGFSFSLREFS